MMSPLTAAKIDVISVPMLLFRQVFSAKKMLISWLKTSSKKVVDSTFFNVGLSLTILINIAFLIAEVHFTNENTTNAGDNSIGMDR